jgi:hypothetical protein
MTLTERFWTKVTQRGDCWIWTHSTNSRGYGLSSIAGKVYLAHRLAYEFLRAEIPAGLTIDHLCRVKACVNPWHMEPVTVAENNRRSQPERTAGSRRAWAERRAA